MARLLGINLSDNHRIEYALTQIYGIGWITSRKILTTVKINRDERVHKLTEADLKKIQDAIEGKIKVEGDLKEEINSNIKRMREIGSYKGLRHIHGLPVRGQRTKSNARTRRGKRRTVGAMKKEDMLRVQASATKK